MDIHAHVCVLLQFLIMERRDELKNHVGLHNEYVLFDKPTLVWAKPNLLFPAFLTACEGVP